MLAVQAMSSEYGTGTIGSTLAASPSRRLVLLAEAAAVTTVALVAGVLGVLGSLVAGRAILPGNGSTSANGYEPLSLADGPTLRAAVGTVLYLALGGAAQPRRRHRRRGHRGSDHRRPDLALRLPDRRPARDRPALAAGLERYGRRRPASPSTR